MTLMQGFLGISVSISVSAASFVLLKPIFRPEDSESEDSQLQLLENGKYCTKLWHTLTQSYLL